MDQRKFKRNVLRYKSFLFHNIAGKLSSTQKKLVTQNSIPDNKVFDYVIDVYIPKGILKPHMKKVKQKSTEMQQDYKKLNDDIRSYDIKKPSFN